MDLTIRCHTDLEHMNSYDILWFSRNLTAEQLIEARTIGAVELCLERSPAEGIQLLYETGFDVENRIICAMPVGSFVVLFDDRIVRANRIRSYKGLFGRNSEIKRGPHLEIEVPFDSERTALIGIAPITDDNYREAIGCADAWDRACMIQNLGSSDETMTQDFLRNIAGCLGASGVDFDKLILLLCNRGYSLFRILGDQAETTVNIVAFANTGSSIQIVREAFTRVSNEYTPPSLPQ